MHHRRTIICFGILSVFLFSPGKASAEQQDLLRRTLEFKGVERTYYVHLPSGYEAEKIYWPLVTVHGGGGNGSTHFLAKDIRSVVDEMDLDAIVVSPSFSNEDMQSSRFPALGEGAFLQAILEDLHAQYKLHPKILLTGYSRGGQFSHRFAYSYPALVKAVAPFAAGTWTTPDGKLLIETFGMVDIPDKFLSNPDNVHRVPERLNTLFTPRVAGVAGIPALPQARDIPFLIMCGSLDTRFEIARHYAKSLETQGYKVTTGWPRTPLGSRDKEEYKTEFKKYGQRAVEFFIDITSVEQ